jgi:hypothetical protein
MRFERWALAVCVVLSCTRPFPLYCDEGTPCTSPEKPYCDFTGVTPESEGHGRVCVATKPCTESSECAGICDTALSTCAACVTSDDCSDGRPICDAGECRMCRRDTECDDRKASAEVGVCDRYGDFSPLKSPQGRCLASAKVLFVSDKCGTTRDGSKGAPFCDVDQAIKALPMKPFERHIVVEAGTYPPFTSYKGRIIGKEKARVSRQGATVPAVVTARETVLDGLEIVGEGSGIGLLCIGCTARSLDIHDHGYGVRDTIAPESDNYAILEACIIHHNTLGGIAFTGSSKSSSQLAYRIVNDVVHHNGGNFAVTLGPWGVLPVFAFNTLSTNLGSIECNGKGQTRLSSSILFGHTLGAGCVSEPVESAAASFVDAANGNFHLAPGSKGVDEGIIADAPVYDFEGQLRSDGKPDVGADELGTP